MRLEEYRELYDKVLLSEKADQRILQEIMEGKTSSIENRFQMRAGKTRRRFMKFRIVK